MSDYEPELDYCVVCGKGFWTENGSDLCNKCFLQIHASEKDADND